MKKNILIADDLIRDYTQIYSKHFKIDTLWNIKGKKINFSKYDALVASGLFKITPFQDGNGFFLKDIFFSIL